MAGLNLAVETPQDNLTNPTVDRVFTELGFSAQFPFAVERQVMEDEADERDDTAWQDFLGYHSEVLR